MAKGDFKIQGHTHRTTFEKSTFVGPHIFDKWQIALAKELNRFFCNANDTSLVHEDMKHFSQIFREALTQWAYSHQGQCTQGLLS
jgi:hypothetical protein